MRLGTPFPYRADARFFCSAVFAAGALLAGTPVRAQMDSLLSEKDFLSDMPIVLSVSRLPQRLDETPGAVTILDRDMIRRSGARHVADLLRLVPGFQVSNAFESGAPLVSYHGAFNAYSNRIELLIDGRSAYSPSFIGSIGPGLQTVALEDIERIEVLRGSNSAAYGARAMLGVINIVTRDTADTLGAQGSVTAGENGVRDTQARIGWGEWGKTFRLTADRQADDGLTGANGKNQESRVNFRADVRPNGIDDIQLRLGALEVEAGKGDLGNIDNPWHDFSFASSYAQLDWKRSLGDDADLAFKLSHSQETYVDEFPYSLLPLGINDIYMVRANGQAQSDVVSLQYTQRHNQTVRTVWGGELRSERVQSASFYNTDADFVTDFSRLFGNLEWRVAPDWLVNAGALVEHSSVSGDATAPRLMVNWQMAAGQTVRAGVSEAFRPPSTFENFADVRYIYRVGVNSIELLNPVRASGQVQAETLVAKEIGYLGDFPNIGLNLDVRLFDEHLSGFIRKNDHPGAKDYVNSEDFSIRGVEYQLKWQAWQGAQFVLNQAHTHISSMNPNSAMAAPELATSLAYFQQLPGHIELSLMHTDNRTAVLFGAGAAEAQSMTRTDLRLAKALRWGARRGEVALVMQNLGSPYSDYLQNFVFERRAFVTLRLED